MSASGSVAVVGVGNIGRAWAIAFARGGCEVRLYDNNSQMLDQSLELIGKSIDDLVAAGLVESASPILERIRPISSLDAALDGVCHVQEAVREDLELKLKVFADLDARTPADVVLASSSSEFMSSEFVRDVQTPERCLVAHPFNPPYLIPVVEISGHEGADEELVEQTRVLFDDIGMEPVVVKKEIKAFLLNRLQAAVVQEALHLVDGGYCSAEDLDRAMTQGLAARWSFMGPFMTGHLNALGGYREYMRTYGGIFRRTAKDLARDYDWGLDLIDSISSEMEKTFPTDKVVAGQQWRDRRLMSLLKHSRSAESIT